MSSPIYPRLVDRLRRMRLEISIPCRHGRDWEHCTHDDEGSHVSEGGDGVLRSTDGTSDLLPTDFCYCGEATHISFPLEIAILAHRVRRRYETMVSR